MNISKMISIFIIVAVIVAFLFTEQCCFAGTFQVNLSLVAETQSQSPSLSDLGFKESDIASNPEFQARLEKRTSMLKTHQVLGLITAVPMIATYFLGGSANNNAGVRNTHMALGMTTASLYFTSASFAIFAPKPEGIENKGSTKIHETLAYIHFPLMIITPILGALAMNQRDNGEKVHGLASYHGAAATTLLISYLASAAVLTINF